MRAQNSCLVHDVIFYKILKGQAVRVGAHSSTPVHLPFAHPVPHPNPISPPMSSQDAGSHDDLCKPAFGLALSMFIWLWLVVNDRKFSVGTIFFSHINQPAVLFHEPATKRTSQPNRLMPSAGWLCYCQGPSPPQRLAGNLPVAEVASPYRPYPCRLVDFAAAKSTTAPRLPRSNQAGIFKKHQAYTLLYLQPGGNG